MRSRLSLVLLLLISAMSTTVVYAGNPVQIEDAWIADAPAVVKVRAGYLIIQNTTKHMLTVKSFSSPAFARVEIHQTISKNGMARMERASKLSIAPGKQLEFKPGGYHLMLFDPAQPLKTGDKINFTLMLKNGKEIPFTASVRKRSSKQDADHQHHHHMHH